MLRKDYSEIFNDNDDPNSSLVPIVLTFHVAFGCYKYI